MIDFYDLVVSNLENLNGLRLHCNVSISNDLVKLDLHNKEEYDLECCYYFDKDESIGEMVALHLKNVNDGASYLFKLPVNNFNFHDIDKSITIIYSTHLFSNYIRIYFN